MEIKERYLSLPWIWRLGKKELRALLMVRERQDERGRLSKGGWTERKHKHSIHSSASGQLHQVGL